MLKILDLFSGIGGFSLGLERTGGFETVAFCELDHACCRVLKKHWPTIPIFNDVRTLDYDGAIDIITGGYPCQPFSVAGQRKGESDDRHLWPSMFGLIKKHRPTWVLGENVAGHITMGLDDVLADLEGEGYATRTFVIPACATGAPHRRDRVWIVANNDGKRQQPGPEGGYEAGGWSGDICEDVSHSDSHNVQGVIPGNINQQQNRKGQDYGEARPFHAGHRWQWKVEPDVGRVADGIPGRVDRLKQLGNTVVPQVVEAIGHAILQAHYGEYK